MIWCGLAGATLFGFASATGADKTIDCVIACVLRTEWIIVSVFFWGILRIPLCELEL